MIVLSGPVLNPSRDFQFKKGLTEYSIQLNASGVQTTLLAGQFLPAYARFSHVKVKNLNLR
jgi:hypothetical protein